VKPGTLIALILAAAVIVLLIIWVAPVVGLSNSACQQYPYTSGCR
jgi:hypothetical protein